MAFSYNLVSPGTRDKLRLTIGDNNPDEYIFEDAELDMALDMEDSDINMAAGIACRAIATNSAKQAIAVKLMDVSIDKKNIAKLYMDLAEKFESKEVNSIAEYVDSYAFEVDAHGHDRSEYINWDEFL